MSDLKWWGLTPHTVPLNLAGLRHLSQTATTPKQTALVRRYWREMFKHQWDGPGLHDLMKELRAILDEYPGDRMSHPALRPAGKGHRQSALLVARPHWGDHSAQVAAGAV